MRIRRGGDIIDNKQIQPINNAGTSIGIIYPLISAIIGTIFCTLVIIAGEWVKNLNSDKTAYTKGNVMDVSDCDFKKKTCISTIQFVVKNKEYTVKSTTGVGNKGQNIGIYYDPENPNNFATNNYSTVIGWFMIIASSIIILLLWLWFIFALVFKSTTIANTANPNF
jgi:hypothetical protein